MLSNESREIIENIVIKYRYNLKEDQVVDKIFKVSMGSLAKDELLKDISLGRKIISEIVDFVNSWPLEKLESEFKKRDLFEVKEKKKKILVFPRLENVIFGKVVTAFPPEPSKYPHIGHAYATYMNYLFAKDNDGKFVLRFEDTNPTLVKKEYYDAMLEGIEWLCIKPDEVIYASSYMDLFYEKAEDLIRRGLAYICLSSREDLREARQKKIDLVDRNRNILENLTLFNELRLGKRDDGVLLAKMNMQDVRAEFRDPALFRINKDSHPLTNDKYCFWPSYIFQNTIMDSEFGITHRFRSKEFEPWKLVQKQIAKWFNYPYPQIFEYAKVNLVGTKSSGRDIREQVNLGSISWDSPTLTTLVSLKRRGFRAEAILEFLGKMGLSKTESNIEWSVLESINRKYLNDCLKISAFSNPIKVNVLDPLGLLDSKISGYIDSDVSLNKEFRIKGLANVVYDGVNLIVTSKEPKSGLNLISFANDVLKVSLMHNESEVYNIYIDSSAYSNLQLHDMVNLQGFGFCSIDDLEKKVFLFAHK